MLKPTFLIRLLSSLYLILLSSYCFADTPVEVEHPTVTESVKKLTLSGSLTAKHRSWLSPRVDGLVQEVRVDAGDRVQKGEVLLRQDSAIAQQALAQAKAATTEAQASVAEAERLVNEAKRLRGDNYISATELANRESNYALSRASLTAAQAMQNTAAEQLERHELPAPFAGVISAKMTEAGEWINRGDQVLELVGLESVRLDVNVPQERFSEITTQSKVDILPDALPDQQLRGNIMALVPVSSAQARSFLVRINIDAEEVNLLPGTSAKAIIHLDANKKAGLLVPRDAVLRHPDGGRSVFIVDSESRAQRRSVQISSESSDGIIISDGIDADDLVVVRGNEALQDNDKVDISDD